MTRTVDDVLKVIEDDGFVSWKEIQNMRAEILALRAERDTWREGARGVTAELAAVADALGARTDVLECARNIRAERNALRAAVTWRRPIGSAPQDGTKILVRQSFSLDSEEAVSAERGGWATDDGSVLYGFNAFDEWLPVPGSAERHAAVIARAQDTDKGITFRITAVDEKGAITAVESLEPKTAPSSDRKSKMTLEELIIAHKAERKHLSCLRELNQKGEETLELAKKTIAYLESIKPVIDEILRIAGVYREQSESGNIGTPGGLEHMGDVWQLFMEWEAMLQDV